MRQDHAQQTDSRLARQVRSEIRSGRLSKVNDTSLNKLRSMHQREPEAKHFDNQHRLATKRERARKVAIQRVARIKTLLG